MNSDADHLVTKEDCLTEMVHGDDLDLHVAAMQRFYELGGTREELNAEFTKTLEFMERVLRQGLH